MTIYILAYQFPYLSLLFCKVAFKTKEKEERMIENKAELDNWIKDIVAYHKVKRKFVSLKDMESEDADHFLICEFRGYNFDIVD
ncbi:MAG: hypothetical protein ABJB85_10740 [Nitrososphaerota archaeon]